MWLNQLNKQQIRTRPRWGTSSDYVALEHRNTIDAEVITLIALTLIRLLQDNVFVII